MRGDEQQNVLTLSISEGRLLTWPRIITDPVHLKKKKTRAAIAARVFAFSGDPFGTTPKIHYSKSFIFYKVPVSPVL